MKKSNKTHPTYRKVKTRAATKQLQASGCARQMRIALDERTLAFVQDLRSTLANHLGVNPSSSTLMRRAVSCYWATITRILKKVPSDQLQDAFDTELQNLILAANRPSDWDDE